jgi:putative membrane protein
MTGPTYDDRSGEPGPGGEPYPGAGPESGPTTGPRRAVPKRTRVSGIWVASIAAAIVLLLLLIFILQNSESVKINFFGANPTLPVGVALLLAAVLGALLVAFVAAARMVQLRRAARKMARTSR